MTDAFPDWTYEEATIEKGHPTVTVDKSNHLVRYYDANGKQVMAAPAGTGLISGPKHEDGDNRTPEGTFRLGKAENTENKKGGTFSFGPAFFRIYHKNDDGTYSGVGLHGTGVPFLNGGNISHGCIRTDNSFIDRMRKLGGASKIVIYEWKKDTLLEYC